MATSKIKRNTYYVDFGEVTRSDLETRLDTETMLLVDGQMLSFRFTLTEDSSPFGSGSFSGYIVRAANLRANGIVQRAGSFTALTYTGSRTSSGWVWKTVTTS